MFKYLLRPMEHGMASQYPSVGIPGTFAPATQNVKALRHSIRKRWGYAADRDLGAGVVVNGVYLFQTQVGARSTIFTTDTDICKRETGSGKTFSYLTPVYSTGTVTVSGATVTLTGTGASFITGGVAAGDKFIVASDHTSDEEPDTHWATVLSVDNATTVKLTASYTGAGLGPGAAYKIRKVYSVPSGEGWSCCSVGRSAGSYFVAANGNVPAQYWDGSAATMADIDATYFNKPRYVKSFGGRLIGLDKDDETNGSTRNPFLLGWSTITNPLSFDYATDSSSGRHSFADTGDFTTGMAVAGPNLVIFKRNGFHVGYSTDDATWPFNFPVYRPGTGCRAPRSIIEAMGTVFWLGDSDFYRLDGDLAVAMGENAIYKVYDVINETEAQNVWGFANHLDHELVWVAPSTDGAVQYLFSWDYKYNEWNMYKTADFITAGGVAAI